MGKSATDSSDPVLRSVGELIRAIEALPSDEPKDREGAWYKTQKEHWLGWLAQYHTPGAYGRKGGGYDAKYAYNHIVNPYMLMWLIAAAGAEQSVVTAVEEAEARSKSLMQKAGAVRRLVPWEAMTKLLWPNGLPDRSAEPVLVGKGQRGFFVTFQFEMPFLFNPDELEPSSIEHASALVPTASALDLLAQDVRSYLEEEFGSVELQASTSSDHAFTDQDYLDLQGDGGVAST